MRGDRKVVPGPIVERYPLSWDSALPLWRWNAIPVAGPAEVILVSDLYRKTVLFNAEVGGEIKTYDLADRGVWIQRVDDLMRGRLSEEVHCPPPQHVTHIAVTGASPGVQVMQAVVVRHDEIAAELAGVRAVMLDAAIERRYDRVRAIARADVRLEWRGLAVSIAIADAERDVWLRSPPGVVHLHEVFDMAAFGDEIRDSADAWGVDAG